MGTFTRPVVLYSQDLVRSESMDALVNSGATYSLIPRPVLERLGIEPLDEMEFALADSRVITRSIAQVQVQVEGRRTVTWCIFGDADSTPFLGAYTLEGLRLAVDSFNKRLVPLRGYLTAPSTGSGQGSAIPR